LTLSVTLFSHSRSVFNPESFQNDKKVTFVCPRPSIADSVRQKFSKEHGRSVQSITISKFIKDLIAELGLELSITRKSDLMLELSSLWKIRCSELSEEIFHQAFNHLTELRSFTMDPHLIDEALNHLDPTLSEVVRLFWLYIDAREIIDEQKSYQLITDSLNDWDTVDQLDENQGESPGKIIFFGFSHLSSGQVDLLQSLSRIYKVDIPFPGKVYDKTINSDWIRWVSAASENVFKEKDEYQFKQEISYKTFPKNSINKAVKAWGEENIGKKQIVLAEKNPSGEQLAEVAIEKAKFKSEIKIFASFLDCENENIRALFRESKQESISSEDLENYLEMRKEEAITKGKKDFKFFRNLKVIEEIQKVFKIWQDLSSENNNLSLFEWGVFLKIIQLNLPRNSLVSLTQEEDYSFIGGYELLNSHDSNIPVLICVQSKYRSLLSGGEKYEEEIAQILGSLGPLQRSELDFLILKQSILEVLEDEKSSLLIEYGLLESDRGWSQILASFPDHLQRDLELKEDKKEYYDYLKDEINKEKIKEIRNMSASRMQTYFECPRRYHFQYNQKFEIEVDKSIYLEARELGELEHKAVELYYKENERPAEGGPYLLFCKKVIEDYCLEKKKVLEKVILEEALVEVSTFSYNGIKEINKLISLDPLMELCFEKELSSEKYPFVNGRVDLLIKSKKLGNIVIDFKRSEYSIPTKSQLEALRYSQIWYYLFNLEIQNEDIFFWGYFNLSSPESSLFMVQDKEKKEDYKELLFAEGSTPGVLGKELLEMEGEFLSFMNKNWEELRTDENFLARPVDSAVCQFCVVKSFCSRRDEV
jgi:hypothetical protein